MDDALTNEEMAKLAALGWKIGGGGLLDGVVKVRGERDGGVSYRTRKQWRALIPTVSLHTTPALEKASLEESQLERALIELDELRTALEKQSTALAELRAAYDQRGKAIDAATAAANRFRAALWGAVERLGEGEILGAERVIKGALE